MSPYRDESVLPCPRCKRPLPGFDVRKCTCGVWVSTFAARLLLDERELRVDPITRWWRKREACPICEDQMTLRGDEPGLFQGCDVHGYWIDDDTIQHTGLARGIDHDAIRRRRDDTAAVDAHRERMDQLLAERAKHRETVAEREDAVDEAFEPPMREEIAREFAARARAQLVREHVALARAQRAREQAERAREQAERERAERLRVARRDYASVHGRLHTTGDDVIQQADCIRQLLDHLGRDATTYVLTRIATLEVKNAELEQRVQKLERALTSRPP